MTGQEDIISNEPPTFCEPFIDSLPIARAAISTLKNPFDIETICATDEVAARIDELQIDLGVGPCWEALTTRAPVIVTDVQHTTNPLWPSLHSAIAESGIHGVFAFPLVVGSLEIGAVDLYTDTPRPFSPTDVTRASALADIAAMLVLNQAIERRSEQEGALAGEGPYSRRDVHQATGMVIAQMKVDADDALVLIRARAFADGISVRETAERIINREISFPL